jgi:DNA polymerase-3 subunit delta'
MSGRGLLARPVRGQEGLRAHLAQAAATGRLSHAYLLTGPAGAGAEDLAQALAQAALCPRGGCGSCDDCERVERGTHPDVHVLRPESAQGYLVDQVRGLIADLDLAPIRARRRAYILTEAERLTPATANALLKSLEEPPADVMFVLVASTADAVLPTVVSRCQVLNVPGVGDEAAAADLARELGLSPDLCRRAVACCASPAAARAFALSPARQEARRCALDALDRLPDADELDLLKLAKAVLQAAKATLDDVREAQQARYDESARVLGGPALKTLEERQKRELAACERSAIIETLGAVRSLLRDALGRCAGEAREPVCGDFARAAERYARDLGLEGVTRALGAAARAEGRLRANVSPQLALEALLFDIKEIF